MFSKLFSRNNIGAYLAFLWNLYADIFLVGPRFKCSNGKFAKAHRDVKLVVKNVSRYRLDRTNTIALTKAIEVWRDVLRNLGNATTAETKEQIKIVGWCVAEPEDITEFFESQKALGGVVGDLLLHVWRPDIAYRSKGRLSRHTGFVIKLLGNPGNLTFIDTLASKFSLHRLPSDADPELQHGEFEIFSYRKALERNPSIMTLFVSNPIAISMMLEATLDRTLAQAVIDELSSASGRSALAGIPQEALLRLAILTDTQPSTLCISGWQILETAKPVWIGVDQEFQSPLVLSKINVVGIPEIDTFGFKEIEVIESKYTVFENLHLYKGGTMVVGSKIVNNDPAQNPQFSFTAGRWDHVFASSANLQVAAIRLPNTHYAEVEEALILTSRADSNWFHWLIETLPKLFGADQVLDKRVPILINTRVPESGKELLRRITDREIIEVEADKMVLIRKAYVPGPVIYLPDALEIITSARYSAVNFSALQELRSRVLSIIPTSDQHEIRTFLKRSTGSRGVTNAKSLEKYLASRGFDVVDPVKLDLDNQLSRYLRSRVLITPGGAAMSNFIFLPSEANVAVLVGKENSHFAIPAILARVAGANIEIISGGMNRFWPIRDKLAFIHSDYSISIRKVAWFLRRISWNG